MLLSRDDILKADDLETRTVPVPEWGGDVLVRAMTGEARDAFEASLTKRRPSMVNKGQMEDVPDTANMRARMVALSIVGEDGELLFNQADIVALGKKSAGALNRVFKVASEMSALGEDDAESAEGNSDDAPSGVSTSGSPEITA
jgi:hypothetical protein